MGWGGGTDIAIGMIEAFQKENIDPDVRKRLYETMLDVLTDRDWDVVDEAMGIDEIFDEVVKEWNPAYENDYDDELEN